MLPMRVTERKQASGHHTSVTFFCPPVTGESGTERSFLTCGAGVGIFGPTPGPSFGGQGALSFLGLCAKSDHPPLLTLVTGAVRLPSRAKFPRKGFPPSILCLMCKFEINSCRRGVFLKFIRSVCFAAVYDPHAAGEPPPLSGLFPSRTLLPSRTHHTTGGTIYPHPPVGPGRRATGTSVTGEGGLGAKLTRTFNPLGWQRRQPPPPSIYRPSS